MGLDKRRDAYSANFSYSHAAVDEAGVADLAAKARQGGFNILILWDK